jgi:hypothetical protein
MQREDSKGWSLAYSRMGRGTITRLESVESFFRSNIAMGLLCLKISNKIWKIVYIFKNISYVQGIKNDYFVDMAKNKVHIQITFINS